MAGSLCPRCSNPTWAGSSASTRRNGDPGRGGTLISPKRTAQNEGDSLMRQLLLGLTLAALAQGGQPQDTSQPTYLTLKVFAAHAANTPLRSATLPRASHASVRCIS